MELSAKKNEMYHLSCFAWLITFIKVATAFAHIHSDITPVVQSRSFEVLTTSLVKALVNKVAASQQETTAGAGWIAKLDSGTTAAR